MNHSLLTSKRINSDILSICYDICQSSGAIMEALKFSVFTDQMNHSFHFKICII